MPDQVVAVVVIVVVLNLFQEKIKSKKRMLSRAQSRTIFGSDNGTGRAEEQGNDNQGGKRTCGAQYQWANAKAREREKGKSKVTMG